MMFDMMTEAPSPGTPMESLMMMVWRMRQDVRLQETRAIVHAVVAAAAPEENTDQANRSMQAAWADYIDELFPFQRGQRKNSDQAAIDYLKREAARGPLKVTPLRGLARTTSKLRQRHDKVSDERLAARTRRRRRKARQR